MRLRIRLLAWYVVCAAILIGHIAWFAALRLATVNERRFVLLVGAVVLEALIAAIIILLRTTPTNALRLSRRRSDIVILGGTILIQLAALGIASPAGVRGVLSMLAVIATCAVMLRALRARDASAWWAIVVTWNPLIALATL